jgi:hypothetical protein
MQGADLRRKDAEGVGITCRTETPLTARHLGDIYEPSHLKSNASAPRCNRMGYGRCRDRSGSTHQDNTHRIEVDAIRGLPPMLWSTKSC